jgi:uncharacterized protein with HEPN domain
VSPRAWQRRVQDILDAIREIQRFTADLDYERFSRDPKTLKAVIMDLAIIGEAASQLDQQVQAPHPEIPWPVIRAMRNHLIHAYFQVDPLIVWNTIQNDLEPLIEPLERMLTP